MTSTDAGEDRDEAAVAVERRDIGVAADGTSVGAAADNSSVGIAADLVAYLVIEVPDRQAVASLVPPLCELVDRAAIRILDVVVVVKGHDGVVDALEVDEIDGLEALRRRCAPFGDLLSEQDIRLATLPIRPGSVGLALVTEDRWAAQLSSAAHVVGGRIVAGERIPPARVDLARAHGGEQQVGQGSEGSAET
jgi:hypothetical protein